MPWGRRNRDRQPAEPAQPSSVNISGITNSAVATGSNNQQYVGARVTTPPPDPAALDGAIAALRAVVEAQAGAGSRRDEALGRVAAIETAARATPPDAGRLATAAEWIRAAIPAAAPAIARVIEHPTLDGAVAAAAQIIHDTAAHAQSTGAHPAADGGSADDGGRGDG